MEDNKHKYRIWPFVLGTIGGLALVLVIIESIALYGESTNTKFVFLETADKWIALIGAILSYVGTCFIGIIAMWQNKELNKVNERLLTIEERRIVPKLACKANNIKHIGGRARLYFQIEHVSGDAAKDIRIEDIVIFSASGEFQYTEKSNDRSGDLCDGIQTYWVECEDVVNEWDDIEMEFCLCFSDILGASYRVSQRVQWKGRVNKENSDYTSMKKRGNDEKEVAGVC